MKCNEDSCFNKVTIIKDIITGNIKASLVLRWNLERQILEDWKTLFVNNERYKIENMQEFSFKKSKKII